MKNDKNDPSLHNASSTCTRAKTSEYAIVVGTLSEARIKPGVEWSGGGREGMGREEWDIPVARILVIGREIIHGNCSVISCGSLRRYQAPGCTASLRCFRGIKAAFMAWVIRLR